MNEKWMKEFVFFGMIIIPVYMFSALLNAFIFNSIQFWSGDNSIKASDLDDDGQTKVAQIGDLTMRWRSTSECATVTYERSGVIERHAMIVSSTTGYRLLKERGNTLAEVEYGADGTLAVLDHDCRVVHLSGIIRFFDRLSEEDEGWMECGDWSVIEQLGQIVPAIAAQYFPVNPHIRCCSWKAGSMKNRVSSRLTVDGRMLTIREPIHSIAGYRY